MSAPLIPLEDQVACVKREIGYRERVYARWVSDGKMTKRKADFELAAMRAVLATLERVETQERLI